MKNRTLLYLLEKLLVEENIYVKENPSNIRFIIHDINNNIFEDKTEVIKELIFGDIAESIGDKVAIEDTLGESR